MIAISRLAKMASAESEADDAAVLEAFGSFRASQNADDAFEGLLGAACAIAQHRPHLLEQLLPRPIDAAVCMGVVTLDDFQRYAEFCAQRSLSTPGRAAPHFTEATQSFVREELPKYHEIVQRVLDSRLREIDG
jgi:hypothetical protein